MKKLVRFLDKYTTTQKFIFLFYVVTVIIYVSTYKSLTYEYLNILLFTLLSISLATRKTYLEKYLLYTCLVYYALEGLLYNIFDFGIRLKIYTEDYICISGMVYPIIIILFRIFYIKSKIKGQEEFEDKLYSVLKKNKRDSR